MISSFPLFLWMVFLLEHASAFAVSDVHSFARQLQNQNDVTSMMIGTGFSFQDADQILVSVQKPLGIVLQQDENDGSIQVTQVQAEGAAGRAGVQVGDVLVAVQNASTQKVDLDNVLDFIENAPRVLNLRFKRL
jgi:C-terminal processing protease CtpA/Prc